MLNSCCSKKKWLSSFVIFLTIFIWSFCGHADTGSLQRKRGEQELKKIVDKALDGFVVDHLPSRPTSNSFVSPEKVDGILHAQSYLTCLIHNSKWAGDTAVNVSLVFPDHCKFSSPHNISLPAPDGDICPLLSGKKILLAGSETSYHTHELWLRMLEHRHNETHDCPGREFCTFHHICRDKAIYPPGDHEQVGRKKKIPGSNFLRTTRSAVLQYTFTTTLYTGSNKSDVIYQRPTIDPGSGIRQASQYWLGRARKADVVLLNLAPLPAPASTYTHLPSGDWGFAAAACDEELYFPSDVCKSSSSYSLAQAALEVTFHKFFPAVRYAISNKAIAGTTALTVWQGNWFIQPSCARMGLPKGMALLTDLWSSNDLSNRGIDPWTYFFNAQVYMQDRILSQILPFYGVYYLSLTLPGLDTAFDAHATSTPDGIPDVKDCIRMPWSSFSDDLGRAYFAAFSSLLTLSKA